MKHFTSPSFWENYEELPSTIQKLADKNYEFLKSDSNHPSLHLKKVKNYWSVRIGRKHRALGILIEEGMLWFWIGIHAEYEQIIKES